MKRFVIFLDKYSYGRHGNSRRHTKRVEIDAFDIVLACDFARQKYGGQVSMVWNIWPTAK